MRPTINTTCSQVVNELRMTGKDVFSADDIERALISVGKGSKGSLENYRGLKGHLAKRGFLHRPIGGWELSQSSKENGRIMITVMPGNGYMIGEIMKTVGDAVKKYGKVVEIRTEV